MRKLMFLIVTALLSFSMSAQDGFEKREKVMIDGTLLEMWVTETGDTLFMANLDEFSVSSMRTFESDAEQNLYKRYRRYAAKVYPYAVEGIKIFREVEHLSEDLTRRQRKKKIKKLQKDLEEKFESKLKQLSKQQGYVLMKMIERELDTPMYKLIKNMRGGFTATYWSTFARFWGHKLKPGYEEGKDPILDVVLKDFDVSYHLPRGANLEKYDKYFKGKNKKSPIKEEPKTEVEN